MTTLDNGGFSRLSNFLSSPQGLAFAQGILSGLQPSMTTPPTLGGALSQGFGGALQQNQVEQQLAMQEQMRKMQERKLGLEEQMARERMKQMQQAQTMQEQQSGLLGKMLQPEGGSDLDPEQKRRAAILYQMGDLEGAAKILAEKTEKDKSAEPTQQFLTQNQKVIQSADNAVSTIDKILEGNVPWKLPFGVTFSPNDKALYKSNVVSLAENLMTARNLPQTEGALKEMMRVVERQGGETEKSYKNRLRELRNEILERKKSASEITNVGVRDTGAQRTVKMYKNGQAYDIPVDYVDQALEEGFQGG